MATSVLPKQYANPQVLSSYSSLEPTAGGHEEEEEEEEDEEEEEEVQSKEEEVGGDFGDMAPEYAMRRGCGPPTAARRLLQPPRFT
ncbi:hypothetical protein E2C01_087331 [Portunus trituberculatus]|uniref:Uncharacterized protein n=1 Tax=Portunus trituberculatus TaxID=210409 RepID=A0A5B7J7U8_PORTR|nr:hypothetical protein [Portunus trituberculatus]